jgi:ASC-1-like (ASCH) protein
MDTSFSLQKIYFDLMKEKKKIKEGRINTGKFKDMKIGDLILVYCSDELKDNFKVTITSRHEYTSFEEMLKNEGLENVLPGIDTISKGVEIYHSISNYKENEIKGVVALGISIV